MESVRLVGCHLSFGEELLPLVSREAFRGPGMRLCSNTERDCTDKRSAVAPGALYHGDSH